jgi:hypothetical protein
VLPFSVTSTSTATQPDHLTDRFARWQCLPPLTGEPSGERLFGAALRQREATLSTKSVVIDALSGRQILAGEEERDATQPFVFYLTQRLGWDPNQLMTRPQWRVPKTPSGPRTSGYPVDIALFDSSKSKGDPDHVRILVECKAPNEREGITQLKTYLSHEPEARLGIWFNGKSHVLVYKTADGFSLNRYAPVPRPSDPLSPTAAREPIRFTDLVPPPNLNEIFLRLRDRIAAQDSHVNRDEFILNDLSNLLICKRTPNGFSACGIKSSYG